MNQLLFGEGYGLPRNGGYSFWPSFFRNNTGNRGMRHSENLANCFLCHLNVSAHLIQPTNDSDLSGV